MAMRSLGSSPVAKKLETCVGRRVSNEDQELRKRLSDERRECEIIQNRYQRQLENVNAELMKLAREALEK